MAKFNFLLTMVVSVLLSTTQVFAVNTPLIDTINVQGYMKLANGTAVPNGTYTLEIGVVQNGKTIWGKSYSVVVTNGLFAQSLSGLGSDLTADAAKFTVPTPSANYSAVNLDAILLQGSQQGEINVRVYASSAIAGNHPTFDIALAAVPTALYSQIAKTVDSAGVSFSAIAAGAYSSLGGASGNVAGVGKLVQYNASGFLDSSVFDTGTPDVPVAAISGNLPSSQIAAGALPAAVTIPATQLTAGALPAGVTLAASQLSAGAIPGTVTADAALITSGTLSAATMIPSLDASKITTGTLPGTVTVPAADLSGTVAAGNVADLSATYAKLSGSTTITMAAAAGISTTAGTGAFDFSNGTGVFKTSTGGTTIPAGGLTITAGGETITAGGLNMNSTNITNVASPAAATDAVNRSYVDGITPSSRAQINLWEDFLSGNANGQVVTAAGQVPVGNAWLTYGAVTAAANSSYSTANSSHMGVYQFNTGTTTAKQIGLGYCTSTAGGTQIGITRFEATANDSWTMEASVAPTTTAANTGSWWVGIMASNPTVITTESVTIAGAYFEVLNAGPTVITPYARKTTTFTGTPGAVAANTFTNLKIVYTGGAPGKIEFFKDGVSMGSTVTATNIMDATAFCPMIWKVSNTVASGMLVDYIGWKQATTNTTGNR